MKRGASPNEYNVKFKIRSVWKKELEETVVLKTYRVSCGFFGEKGEEYLIYAYIRDGSFTTHGCTRTKPYSKAAEDLKDIEDNGEKPIKIYETVALKP